MQTDAKGVIYDKFVSLLSGDFALACLPLYQIQKYPKHHVLKLDLPELKEMISLLRRSSNNLNQIAKRVNETGRIYDTDIEYLCGNQEQLWAAMNETLTKLAALE